MQCKLRAIVAPLQCKLGTVLGSVSMLSLLVACGGAGDEGGSEIDFVEQPLGTCGAQPLAATATASSVENNHFVASWAVDGNMNTRWSSTKSSPQWIRLDLGAVKLVDTVKLDWERAHSRSFELQASNNGITWGTLRSFTNASGGHQEITGLNASARYLRIFSTLGSATWGSISLFEISVLGDGSPACASTAPSCGESVKLVPTAASASSNEASWSTAMKASDGDFGTRWSSAFADNQWVSLDFGADVRIDGARLTWERAYSSAYQLQVATDASGPWTTIYSESPANGGVDVISGLSAVGRYVRMLGSTRATQYGHSLWEFEVYGSRDLSCGSERPLPIPAPDANFFFFACQGTGCQNPTLDPNSLILVPTFVFNPTSTPQSVGFAPPLTASSSPPWFGIDPANNFLGARWTNLELSGGKTYRVSFDAWSTASRTVPNGPTLTCGLDYDASRLSVELTGAPAQTIVAPCITPTAFSVDLPVSASTSAGTLRIVNGPGLDFAEGWNLQNVKLFEL